MPYLKIQTNVSMPDNKQGELLAEASRVVAVMLGKPEQYVMVVVQDGQSMRFAGSDASLAYLELKSIGLPREKTASYSKTLSELMSESGSRPIASTLTSRMRCRPCGVGMAQRSDHSASCWHP